MKCFYCEKEFEPITRQGGMNRLYCYDCLPDGLTKTERERVKRMLSRSKAANDKLKLGCARCGYNKCSAALEWHHINDDKLFNPSDILSAGSVSAYIRYNKEKEKCILLCSNCHREITSGIEL